MNLQILTVLACCSLSAAQYWGDDFGDRFENFGDRFEDRYDDMYDDGRYSPYRWNGYGMRWGGGWNPWGWGRQHYRPKYYHKPRRHFGYNYNGYNPGYSNYGQLMSNLYLYNQIFD